MASSKKRPCAELAARLSFFLQQHIQPGSHLLLGFSGGLDSRVLLDLLSQARNDAAIPSFRLTALYINHGISPHAATWGEFCASVCHAEGIAFKQVTVSVPRDSGLGLEAAARQARYAALRAENADFIVLAHHGDDQAETVLLQLLRGAGVKGMAGMGAVYGKLLRPLLDVTRPVLQEYAQARRLNWIDDESNADTAFDRNFLRHEIFPRLEQRYPSVCNTLARSAEHLAEAAELLDELAQMDAVDVIDAAQGMSLSLPKLRALSFIRGKNLLRYWLAMHHIAMPASRRLEEMLRQLCSSRPDARLLFRMEKHELRSYRDAAWLVPHTVAVPQMLDIIWRGEECLDISGMGRLVFQKQTGHGLSPDKYADRELRVRLRQGGERLRLHAKRPSHSLKHLLQESGIPPWQRAALPMLYCGETLIAVPGIGVQLEWQVSPSEDGLAMVWIPGAGA